MSSSQDPFPPRWALVCDPTPGSRHAVAIAVAAEGLAPLPVTGVADTEVVVDYQRPDIVVLRDSDGTNMPAFLRRAFADTPPPIVLILDRAEAGRVAELEAMGVAAVLAADAPPITVAHTVARVLGAEATGRTRKRVTTTTPWARASTAATGGPVTTLRELLDRLRDGRARLPTFDKRVQELQRLSNRVDLTNEVILRFVGNDATLAPSVLRHANSVLFRGSRAITHLGEACNRLGGRNVVALCMESLMRQGFVVQREPWATVVRNAWRCSALTARIAGGWARQVKHSIPADQIHVGALLHNVGELLIVGWAADGTLQLPAEAGLTDLAAIVARGHERAGELAMGRWGMPLPLRQLAGYHHVPLSSEDPSVRALRLLTIAAWARSSELLGNYLPGGDAGDCDAALTQLGVPAAEIKRLRDEAALWMSSLDD